MTNATSAELVARARELDSLATPGPWAVHKRMIHAGTFGGVGDISVATVDTDPFANEGDAAFIAEARTLLPVLAVEVDELAALNGRLIAALHETVEKNETYKTGGHGSHCRYCGMYEQYTHLPECPIRVLAETENT